MKRGKLSTVLCLLLLSCVLLTCGVSAAETVNDANKPKIYVLLGPTAISITKMAEETGIDARYRLCASPQEAAAALLSGEAELAMLPANLAATLYRKTDGAFRMLCVNTLGMLHILERGGGIKTVQDLAGKTLYASSPGSAAQYALDYVLKANGLDEKVKRVYVADHTELAARAGIGEADIVMLPEPYAQILLEKQPEFRRALDLNALFDDAAKAQGTGAKLAMGCVVVSKAYAEAHPEEVKSFIAQYRKSIEYANSHPKETAELFNRILGADEYRLSGDMIPGCHIVCLTGDNMKNTVGPFFRILLDADPKSIGGSLPGEDFYYSDGSAAAAGGDRSK